MVILVLGITGTFQAGKDTVAALIGWKKYSCSGFIGEEIVRLGLSIDINKNFIDVGDDLRKKFGAGVLGKMAVDRIISDGIKHAIVVSIRTPEELHALKTAQGIDFRLLVFDAPIELRFERAKSMPRYCQMSFDEFKAQEDAQLHGTGQFMHLSKVFEQADARIVNDGKTVDELKVQVDAVLKGWGWL